MRRSLIKVTSPSIGNAAVNSLIASSSTFSTSAGGGGGGGGRGRGGGIPFSGIPFQSATEGAQVDGDDGARADSRSPLPSGLGHGRGKPFPSAPTLPSFSSFIPVLNTEKGAGRGGGVGHFPHQSGVGRGGAPFSPHSSSGRGSSTTPVPPQFSAGRGGAPFPPQSAAGRGRGLAPVPPQSGDGRGGSPAPPQSAAGRGSGLTPVPPHFMDGRRESPVPPQSDHPQGNQQSGAKKPTFFSKRDDMADTTSEPKSQTGVPGEYQHISAHTHDIPPMFHGAGRGKPSQQPISPEPARAANRHLRPRTPDREKTVSARRPTSKWTAEEATDRAVGILSKSRDGEEDRRGGRRAESGGRGGGRGLTRGGKDGGRFRRVNNRDMGKDEGDIGTGLFLGQNADGEKLAERLGTENMNKLVEAFEDMSGRILPSPLEDAYVDALQTNLAIECEPEYLMEEFGTNPDVDEKQTISLQDALEKAKPFFMAYEGLRSQEEWEEAVKEAMNSVPLMKDIVDYYGGPGKVTAKKQQKELELVAQKLPESAPASVKRFTDRALLSLQSNPGWGFNKKQQFMDQLVKQVGKQYR